MKLVAIIMAGGKGERLWPRSTTRFPKQFLELSKGKGSLLQQSVDRIKELVDINDIYIVTNKIYKEIIIKQIKDLPHNNIICEPLSKNTSPAIEYATLFIKHKIHSDDFISLVLSSDHYINDKKKFIFSLKQGIKEAKKDYLVTLGIKPTRAETGYGYIKVKKNSNDVIRFEEKPSIELAKKYYKSKNYYWNSGMFIWKASSILKCFEKYINEQHIALNESIKNKQLTEAIYKKIQSISIDYAILEKAKNIKVIKSNFIWDDIGSWLALSRINKLDKSNNYIEGNVLSLNCNNSVICGDKKLIKIIGLNNIVVVDSKEGLLIANKDNLNNIIDLGNKAKSS